MEVVLERIRAKWLRAVPGDHDRLLEFDALASANRADVALYTDHHVLLKHAVVAGRLHVFWVEDQRVFDRHTGAVDDLVVRSEEHTSELQSRQYLVCRLLLEKKKQ